MCPICGTTLELSEHAPGRARARASSAPGSPQGQTKEQIKDALVAEYGQDVLATPEDSGFDLTAWLVPVRSASGRRGVGSRLALAPRLARRGGRPRRRAAPALARGQRRLERDLSAYDR